MPQGPPGGWGPPPGFYGGPPPNMGGGQQTESLAIPALVCGVLGVPSGFCCSFFSIPICIAAIVLGVMSIMNINKDPARLTGKGLAIGGIVTGSVSLLLFFGLFALGVAGALIK